MSAGSVRSGRGLSIGLDKGGDGKSIQGKEGSLMSTSSVEMLISQQ